MTTRTLSYDKTLVIRLANDDFRSVDLSSKKRVTANVIRLALADEGVLLGQVAKLRLVYDRYIAYCPRLTLRERSGSICTTWDILIDGTFARVNKHIDNRVY